MKVAEPEARVRAPQSAVDRLRRELSGYALQPDDPEYQKAVQIDNGRVQQRPAVVVLASGEKDVATALRFAQEQRLRLTALGGGHSATGYCLNTGGVVVDLSLMKNMVLDPKRQVLRVQMGAIWADVYGHLQRSGTGLIPVGGGCLTVGLPGFIQGGGFSFVSRSYGLGIDSLLSLKIVTADGVLRHISEDSATKEERDLFWALRGGAGGNFGIVTEMDLRVHRPRTEKMFMAQIRYPVERAQEVLGFYNEWVETLPDEMAVYGIWMQEKDPAHGSRLATTFGFTAVYNGEFAEGLKLLEPVLKRQPSLAQLYHLTLPEFEQMIGLNTSVAQRSAYIRSGMMPPLSMTPQVIKILQDNMANRPSLESFMVWTHSGGKVAAVAPDATAFPHRHARFMPEVKVVWTTQQEARENIEWGFRFFQELEPHFRGAYVNYIDPLLTDWRKKYYEGNYPRLLNIKRHWDPDGFFHFQQSIGSPFEPDISQPLDLSPLNRTFVD